MLIIGNDACLAAMELKGNPHWEAIRTGLFEAFRKKANEALDTPAGHQRDDAVGYVRALRDMHLTFESATFGTPFNRVEKPAPVSRKGA